MWIVNRSRISISQKHGDVVIKIKSRHSRVLYTAMIVVLTLVLLWFSWIFVPALRNVKSARGFLILLLPIAFVVVWYLVGLRIAMWRAFGLEKIVVKGQTVLWSRKALWWARTVQTA